MPSKKHTNRNLRSVRTSIPTATRGDDDRIACEAVIPESEWCYFWWRPYS